MPNSIDRTFLWLALAIGNSRLHWAKFDNDRLQTTWDEPHRQQNVPQLPEPLPLWIASVVPHQLQLWETFPNTRIFTLQNVPIQGVYPTLGIDRALAAWGAGTQWGFPVLAIDAGTALTFTGVNADRHLVGGAIVPGLGLQLKTLTQNTADLPPVQLDRSLPPRWAIDTPSALKSGVLYVLLAGLRDFIETWQQQFPGSSVVLTGGDGKLLHEALLLQFPHLADRLNFDPHLIFWGMRNWVIGNG
ncbi:MAG: pantothenate kinase [Geitlerinemataceae cyanobacterium]